MTKQLTTLSLPAEIEYMEGALREIAALGPYTAKSWLYKTETAGQPWALQADLTCFVFENNYAVKKDLQKYGVIVPAHDDADPEMSCFYCYFDSRESSVAFMKRFRKWVGERTGKIKAHIKGLRLLAEAMKTLDGSINTDETTAIGLAKWIIEKVNLGTLSPGAKLAIRFDDEHGDHVEDVAEVRTEMHDGEQQLVFGY